MKNFDPKVKTEKSELISLSPVSKFLSVFISLMLLIPFIWGLTVTDHQARSKAEKRNLAPFPHFTLSNTKEYFGGLSTYLRDHIGFGLVINQFYQKTMFNNFDTVGIENISKGSDGFVFLTSHNPTKHNVIFSTLCLHNTDPSNVVSSAEKLNKMVTGAGHRAIFAVPISKPSLYPEKLPSDVSDIAKGACNSFLKNANFLTKAKVKLAEDKILLHYPVSLFLTHKNDESFYPKTNFHWDGLSAHLFAKSLFTSLGVDKLRLRSFDDGAKLVTKHTDLTSIGFERTTKVWEFPYQTFGISENQRNKLNYIKKYYDRAGDVSYYSTKNPLQNKNAVLISNSFGAFTARHLAVGYKSLIHININHLKPSEQKGLFSHLFALDKKMDIIFLFHDDAMAGHNALDKMARNIN